MAVPMLAVGHRNGHLNTPLALSGKGPGWKLGMSDLVWIGTFVVMHGVGGG
jgi:hypothetical protein